MIVAKRKSSCLNLNPRYNNRMDKSLNNDSIKVLAEMVKSHKVAITSHYRTAFDRFLIGFEASEKDAQLVSYIELFNEKDTDAFISYRDEFTNSILISAAARSYKGVTAKCLELGIDPNNSNREGVDAMNWALVHKNENIMDSLLQSGYKLKIKEGSSLIYEIFNGLSYYAVKRGYMCQRIMLSAYQQLPGEFDSECEKARKDLEMFERFTHDRPNNKDFLEVRNFLDMLKEKKKLEEIVEPNLLLDKQFKI